MTFAVYVKLKLSINERISHFRLLPEKQHNSKNPHITWLCILYLATKIISLQKKEVTAPKIAK